MNEKQENKTELKDAPNMLAFGVKDAGGKLHKNVSFKKWNMRMEKEIGKKIDAYGDELTESLRVNIILSNIIDTVGPYDFSEMKDVEKSLVISRIYMGDVLTIWFALRLHAMGNILKMSLKCPHCKNDFSFSADLGTVEIQTTDDIEKLFIDYKLEDSMEIRKKEVSEIQFGPHLWSAMENFNGNNINLGDVKDAVIKQSIVKMNGFDQMIVLTDDEMDGMSKKDFEKILEFINEIKLGPIMTVEASCTKCEKKFTTAIDWKTDNFFAGSSL